MRSFDRHGTALSRFLPAAALLAALFVPLLNASAEDGCPPGGCPLPPPQSREINPAPARADGSTVHIASAGGLPPVEITVHMLAPSFVDPAPLGSSFEAISVPVRYQDPGDVSCGVQALGMALDALPGAAPASSALLNLLQDQGMMYDFGTGVEELAYAAQSFGYAGSYSFHGASLGQLQAQLDSGSPVVVSLGANGEATPGHFVTVTGISADGDWVAFNDPTLGEQVVSATEFERLWGLQGNSGVAVATEPPPEVADPGVLALWVAFTAGLMALVSTTPVAKLRLGVGGMLDAGPGSYTSSKSAPKPAAKSNPPDKEKEKKPKKKSARFDDEIVVPPPTPKATKPRFDDEPPPPPKPISSVVLTPTEQKAATVAPAATPSYPAARFDEEEDPKPKPKARARFDEGDDPETIQLAATSSARFDDEPISEPVYPVARFDKEEVAEAPANGSLADLAEGIKWGTRLIKLERGTDRFVDSLSLMLKDLDGGYVSVSAPAALREELALAGTRYLPSTVTKTVGSSLIKGSLSNSNLAISGVAAIGTNLYDYGLGEHKDEGVGSQGFWVSTALDLGIAIGVGVGAALAVTAIAGAITMAFETTVAAPILLAGVAIAGLGASLYLDAKMAAPAAKQVVNEFIDEREIENQLIPAPPDLHPVPKAPPGAPE